MIFEKISELKERIEYITKRKVYSTPEIFEDTSSYMSIYSGCILRLGENDYYITGDTREGRFGIDDQPKMWVKYAIDLTTGDKKIIKLVFHEQFTVSVGFIKIRCTRNPAKESKVLELIKGHPRFMQGETIKDTKNNPVRIIDRIPGKSIYATPLKKGLSHEQYYYEKLPAIMKQIIVCFESIAHLHKLGETHGDIRNDHIFIHSKTGTFIWIDFDYEVNYSDYDIWCMGNVINFVIGGGLNTFHDVKHNSSDYPYYKGDLHKEDDAQILYQHRVANLKKLFPYISNDLNDILMRFSTYATDFYQSPEQQINDLKSIFKE